MPLHVDLSAAALAELSELSLSSSAVPAGSDEGEVKRLIADLEHTIKHLERSNAELEEFMRENGNDKELRQAIGENILVIARRKGILADLRKQAGIAEPPPAKTAAGLSLA